MPSKWGHSGTSTPPHTRTPSESSLERWGWGREGGGAGGGGAGRGVGQGVSGAVVVELL